MHSLRFGQRACKPPLHLKKNGLELSFSWSHVGWLHPTKWNIIESKVNFAWSWCRTLSLSWFLDRGRNLIDLDASENWTYMKLSWILSNWFSNKQITNVGQSEVDLSLLVLPCSRILLVQGGIYYMPLWWVGSWLPTYLASFFPSSREKVSQHKSNHQPLHPETGPSPPSLGSLGSSRT